MSWSGYTDNPVFVEAAEATDFERDIIKLQNYMWVNDRNEAMKLFVDEHNKQAMSEEENCSNGNPVEPVWCFKQDINLLQAVEGVTALMTYGRHSDHGPEQMHLSLREEDEVAKYLPHLRVTFSRSGYQSFQGRIIIKSTLNHVPQAS